ncbi:MAG TPA: hypothetical protein DDW85_01620 [Porphyromonadaceae bacterium]|nr:hypothetical protein [Porphyromonadaceae bacterium]
MEKQNVLSIEMLADNKPDVFFDLRNGQGTFLYNHNIKEVLVIKDKQGSIAITDDKKKSTGKMFQYDSLRVEYPKTADNIFSTLLAAKYSTKKESKLVNEYQSATLGLLDKSFKKPYEDFLRDRIKIRESVNADCGDHKIPIDNE